jgi:hypothetical protein
VRTPLDGGIAHEAVIGGATLSVGGFQREKFE